MKTGEFFGVYSSVVDSKREFFREELGAVRGLWNGALVRGR